MYLDYFLNIYIFINIYVYTLYMLCSMYVNYLFTHVIHTYFIDICNTYYIYILITHNHQTPRFVYIRLLTDGRRSRQGRDLDKSGGPKKQHVKHVGGMLHPQKINMVWRCVSFSKRAILWDTIPATNELHLKIY